MKLILTTALLTLAVVSSLVTAGFGQTIVPDFVINRINVELSTGEKVQYITKVRVLVSNLCKNSDAVSSYALITFSESEKGKKLFYLGNSFAPIAGGKSTWLTLDVTEKKLTYRTYIRAEVDPYQKIYEGSEDNNWATYYMNRTPKNESAPLGTPNCSPKF